MKRHHRVRHFALAAAVLVSANCATLQMNGPSQRIRVTSTPPGAEVSLDGRPAGGVEVTVSRRNRAPVIRVEKDGFRPHEQKLQRSPSWWLLADAALAGALYLAVALTVSGPGAWEIGEGPPTFNENLIAASVAAAPLVVDFLSGAAFTFRPGQGDAALGPARARRMEAPAPLRARLRRALARRAAPRDLTVASGAARRPTNPAGVRAPRRELLAHGAAPTGTRPEPTLPR